MTLPFEAWHLDPVLRQRVRDSLLHGPISASGLFNVGGYFGARVVSKLPRRSIQLGMGIALLIAAVTASTVSLAGTAHARAGTTFDVFPGDSIQAATSARRTRMYGFSGTRS